MMTNHANKPSLSPGYTFKTKRSPEIDIEIEKRFREGVGIYKIARDLNMNDHVVRKALKEKGLSTPPRKAKDKNKVVS